MRYLILFFIILGLCLSLSLSQIGRGEEMKPPFRIVIEDDKGRMEERLNSILQDIYKRIGSVVVQPTERRNIPITPISTMIEGSQVIGPGEGTSYVDVIPDTVNVGETQASKIVSRNYFSKLQLDPVPSYTTTRLRVRANWLTLHDGDGNTLTLEDVDETNILGNSGEGGRDQAGSFSAGVWLHFYIIYNASTKVVDSRSSLSDSAPTLPTGSTYYVRVGARRTVNTNVMRAQVSRGSKTWGGYDEAWNMVLINQDPIIINTWELLDISAAVPTTAKQAFGLMGSIGTSKVGVGVASDSTGLAEFRATINSVSPITNYGISASFYFDVPLLTAQTIYWMGSHASNTDATMIIYGWEDDL